MPNEALILDAELEGIQELLETCGTHTASISIRSFNNTNHSTSTTQARTLVRANGSERSRYLVSSDVDGIFSIGSITKVLVAVAVIIATELKAEHDTRYSKFRSANTMPLTELYNNHSENKLDNLPGDPTIYQLLCHYKGVEASIHDLLAPDGSPIMFTADVWHQLMRIARDFETGLDRPDLESIRYNNYNYSIVAMVIETLWGNGLDTFLDETLFKPLGMQSTSIRAPVGRYTKVDNYVVTSSGQPLLVQSPEYGPTGAISGPLGGHSTARDLDRFFQFLLSPVFGISSESERVIAESIFGMKEKSSESHSFGPLGLVGTLNGSMIGSLSSNRLQFPAETFSTYPVMPGSVGRDIQVYHTGGSILGCSLATAIIPSAERESFAVAVLTNTSGPVDVADHILRLISRSIATTIHPWRSRYSLLASRSVRAMVREAMTQTCEAWKALEEADEQLIANAPNITKRIAGVFKAKETNAGLRVFIENQKTYITMFGVPETRSSHRFQLIWMNQQYVKICVPPHLSIDLLIEGQLRDLTYKVEFSGDIVTDLIRRTAVGEDRYTRLEQGISEVIESTILRSQSNYLWRQTRLEDTKVAGVQKHDDVVTDLDNFQLASNGQRIDRGVEGESQGRTAGDEVLSLKENIVDARNEPGQGIEELEEYLEVDKAELLMSEEENLRSQARTPAFTRDNDVENSIVSLLATDTSLVPVYKKALEILNQDQVAQTLSRSLNELHGSIGASDDGFMAHLFKAAFASKDAVARIARKIIHRQNSTERASQQENSESLPDPTRTECTFLDSKTA